MNTTAEGGCLCGAIRFRTTAQPLDAGYCHCTLCQRSTGAPVLAWASYPVDGFSYTQGVPARYQSSKHGHREFCANCGTQIPYRDSGNAATIEINLGALDEPDSVQPRYHIWYASRVSWFATADSLPRFDGPAPQERRT
jgi:hypothetical protein